MKGEQENRSPTRDFEERISFEGEKSREARSREAGERRGERESERSQKGTEGEAREHFLSILPPLASPVNCLQPLSP